MKSLTSDSALLRIARPVALVAVAGFLLAACGSDSIAVTTQPSSGTAAGAEAGVGAGAEAAGVRYTNARYHYRVDTPGTMQEAADGSASARRGEERMAINVVNGASAADIKAYAAFDLQRVQAASPKYHLVQPLSGITISGHASWKAVYTWTDGTNAVTGKPEDLTTVRYYIPRDGNTAAVMAYSISPSQYDPQGADDIAATFAWL